MRERAVQNAWASGATLKAAALTLGGSHWKAHYHHNRCISCPCSDLLATLSDDLGLNPALDKPLNLSVPVSLPSGSNSNSYLTGVIVIVIVIGVIVILILQGLWDEVILGAGSA